MKLSHLLTIDPNFQQDIQEHHSLTLRPVTYQDVGLDLASEIPAFQRDRDSWDEGLAVYLHGTVDVAGTQAFRILKWCVFFKGMLISVLRIHEISPWEII